MGRGSNPREILLGSKPRSLYSPGIPKDGFEYRKFFTDREDYHGWRYHRQGDPVEGWFGTGNYSIREEAMTSVAEKRISLDRAPTYFEHDPLRLEDFDRRLDEFPFSAEATLEYDDHRINRSWFLVRIGETDTICHLSRDTVSMLERNIRSGDLRRWMFLESPETYKGKTSYVSRAAGGPSLYYYNLDKQRVDAALEVGDFLHRPK